MTVLLALRRGIRVVNAAKSLWLISYATLTLVALLPAATLASRAIQSLGHSGCADCLDVEWVGAWLVGPGGYPYRPVAAPAIGLFAIAAILHVFLLGGVIEMFVTRQPFGAGSFFGACGRNFWRLFRLALYCLALCAAVVPIDAALAFIGRSVWGSGSEAGPLVHWNWFRAGVLLVIAGLLNLLFDYAAIHVVAGDRRQVFRSMWQSCRLVWSGFGRIAGLAAALWAFVLVLAIAYLAVSRAFPQDSLGALLALLLVRQAAVLGKIWARLLFYSSQCEMYNSLDPDAGSRAGG